MHLFFFGLLLGFGAAVPIGPINLELIRRNLRFGTIYGIATGLGACFADLTYLVLLCLGALTLLQHPTVLRVIGLVGSFILAWFALQAFKMHARDKSHQLAAPSIWRYGVEGYMMTLVNPMTILFWGSVSSQISLQAITNNFAIVLAGSGVLIGTISWVVSLNIFIHFTRHKLSNNVIKWLNYIGGMILLLFAILGFIRALFS